LIASVVRASPAMVKDVMFIASGIELVTVTLA
jgi:hypothetical protein